MSQERRSILYYSQHKPHPLNALLKDNNSTYRSTLETTERTSARRYEEQMSSKRTRRTFREYSKRLDYSLNHSPLRANFRISDTFAVMIPPGGNDAEEHHSTHSKSIDLNKKLQSKLRKSLKSNAFAHFHVPTPSREQVLNLKKLEPPELNLKTLFISDEQNRLEENVKIYGPSLAPSLLPNRIVVKHLRTISPVKANQLKELRISRNEAPIGSEEKSKSVNHKSDWNMSRQLFVSKPKHDTQVSIYKNALEKRLQAIQANEERKDFIDFLNAKEGTPEVKEKFNPSKLFTDEPHEKVDTPDELDKILAAYDKRSFVKKGNLLYPTMATKFYKLHGLNDDYLLPLLQQTKAKIESTPIML